MRVWIDLANAPHVAFFRPLIRELKRRGHEVALSLRDFNQTVELAQRSGLEGSVIGRHGGRSSAGKMLSLLARSSGLALFGRRERFDVAVSHNSYTQTLAGRLVGARVVTIMDFEGQPANHVAFRLAHVVIVPKAFPASDLRRFGCPPRKVMRYKGFKEQVYLSDFVPDPCFTSELERACALDEELDWRRRVIVTVRTPPSMALYHRFRNPLFDRLLRRLDAADDAIVVLLPRSPDERDYYRRKYPRVRIPSEPLSGSNLVYHSDLVVSAGGTMNREAAVLGTPVCTIFAGELPAVDRCLIGMGRLLPIESERDIDRLHLEKKPKGTALANPGLGRQLVDWITSC